MCYDASSERRMSVSCYFRYIKDVLKEAGIVVSPQNKKQIDQAIHQMVNVKYKKCMPDCWDEVKKRIGVEKDRKAFVSELKKAIKG
jgi:ribosomal protein L23